MADSNNVLIICRDLKSLRRLSRFSPQARSRYILASDDSRVHEAVKKHLWIDEICWIEKMEPFYNVADDVIRLTGIVNQWLKTLADDKRGFPEELLFFIRHVEGGMTTQRIQDLLLLIRSYRFMFDTYEITNVILIRQPGMDWEDDVLIETCQSRKVDIKVIVRYSISVLIKKVKSILAIYTRPARCAVNVFRINLCNRFKSKKTEITNKEIVFQLCSSAYKHVENIVPIMKALKHKGYNPVALCWHSKERYTKETGANQVRREGLWSEELEKWCSFSDMRRSISGVFWTWKKAKMKKRKFLSHQALNYQSVPLGALLWPSVRFFIMAELPQSYSLHRAFKKYFKPHAPLAIKLWGGGTLIEGNLVLKNLTKGKRPLFMYWFWLVFDYPYESKYEHIDLFLTAGKSHENYLHKLGVTPEKMVSVGISRYDNLLDFKKKYRLEQSRSYLNILSTYSIYILYDSNCILRGYLATSEQIQLTSCLLDFAKRHPSVALIIKPHPGHHRGHLEFQISSYSLQNVYLTNKNMLPYHAINAADFVITKFSTIGIEAMLFERPVISVMLDGEMRWKSYGNAAEYITSVQELNKLLTRISEDTEFRGEWKVNQIKKQKEFLKDYFLESTKPSAELAADTIGKFIKNHNC